MDLRKLAPHLPGLMVLDIDPAAETVRVRLSGSTANRMLGGDAAGQPLSRALPASMREKFQDLVLSSAASHTPAVMLVANVGVPDAETFAELLLMPVRDARGRAIQVMVSLQGFGKDVITLAGSDPVVVASDFVDGAPQGGRKGSATIIPFARHAGGNEDARHAH